jgi:hypothetical protein
MGSPAVTNQLTREWLRNNFPSQRFGHVVVAAVSTVTEHRGGRSYRRERWLWNLTRRDGHLVAWLMKKGVENLTFVQLAAPIETLRDVHPAGIYRVPVADLARYRPNVKTIIVRKSPPGRRRQSHFLEPYRVF